MHIPTVSGNTANTHAEGTTTNHRKKQKGMEHRHNRRLLLWGAILIALCGVGCERHTAYHAFRAVPQSGWNRNDTLTFAVPQQDIAQGLYELWVEIRHTGATPYAALWVAAVHTTTDSLHLHTDSLRCALTDEQGHFAHNGVLNHTVSLPLTRFTLPGDYPPTIQLTHCMDQETLQGITDVGVRLVRCADDSPRH